MRAIGALTRSAAQLILRAPSRDDRVHATGGLSKSLRLAGLMNRVVNASPSGPFGSPLLGSTVTRLMRHDPRSEDFDVLEDELLRPRTGARFEHINLTLTSSISRFEQAAATTTACSAGALPAPGDAGRRLMSCLSFTCVRDVRVLAEPTLDGTAHLND